MRTIDMETWPRRGHYQTFGGFFYPHWTLCADVDLTACSPALRERGVSFNVAIVYLIARTANDIPEFRQRIRGDTVVEHDVVHPSSTIMAGDDAFTFCTFEYHEDFPAWEDHAGRRIAEVLSNPSVDATDRRDDLLMMTAIPWVSFTHFSHPIMSIPADSIPRFAWGRYRDDVGRRVMPLSVQAHHALVDGVHVGRYYERIQAYLDEPESFLGAV